MAAKSQFTRVLSQDSQEGFKQGGMVIYDNDERATPRILEFFGEELKRQAEAIPQEGGKYPSGYRLVIRLEPIPQEAG